MHAEELAAETSLASLRVPPIRCLFIAHVLMYLNREGVFPEGESEWSFPHRGDSICRCLHIHSAGDSHSQ